MSDAPKRLSWYSIAQITAWDWDRTPDSFGPRVYVDANSPSEAIAKFLSAVNEPRRKLSRLVDVSHSQVIGGEWLAVVQRPGFFENEEFSYLVRNHPHAPDDVMCWSATRDKEFVSSYLQTAVTHANRKPFKLTHGRWTYATSLVIDCHRGAHDGDLEYVSANDALQHCRKALWDCKIPTGVSIPSSGHDRETLLIHFDLQWKESHEIYLYSVVFRISEKAYLVEDRFLYAIPSNTYEHVILDVATKPEMRGQLFDSLTKQCELFSDWAHRGRQPEPQRE